MDDVFMQLFIGVDCHCVKQRSTNVVPLFPAIRIGRLGSWRMFPSDHLSVWIVIAVKQRSTNFVPLYPAVPIHATAYQCGLSLLGSIVLQILCLFILPYALAY
jgi:hypothetical protein